MKTKKIALIGLSLIALSFTISKDFNDAQAEENNGIIVFCYSKPKTDFEILGVAKCPVFVSSSKGEHLIELLIKDCKKDFPSAEGIIVNSNFEKAEAIRFKK